MTELAKQSATNFLSIDWSINRLIVGLFGRYLKGIEYRYLALQVVKMGIAPIHTIWHELSRDDWMADAIELHCGKWRIWKSHMCWRKKVDYRHWAHTSFTAWRPAVSPKLIMRLACFCCPLQTFDTLIGNVLHDGWLWRGIWINKSCTGCRNLCANNDPVCLPCLLCILQPLLSQESQGFLETKTSGRWSRMY